MSEWNLIHENFHTKHSVFTVPEGGREGERKRERQRMNERMNERAKETFIYDGNGICQDTVLFCIQPSGQTVKTKYHVNIKNTQWERERQRQTERDRETETQRYRDRETETDRDRQISRGWQCGTETARERETGRSWQAELYRQNTVRTQSQKGHSNCVHC